MINYIVEGIDVVIRMDVINCLGRRVLRSMRMKQMYCLRVGDHGVVENSSGKMSVVRSRMRTSVQNLTAINGQLNGSAKRSIHY